MAFIKKVFNCASITCRPLLIFCYTGACWITSCIYDGIESLSAKEIESKIVGGAPAALVSTMKGELNWLSMINELTMVQLDSPVIISSPNNQSSLVESINSKRVQHFFSCWHFHSCGKEWSHDRKFYWVNLIKQIFKIIIIAYTC